MNPAAPVVAVLLLALAAPAQAPPEAEPDLAAMKQRLDHLSRQVRPGGVACPPGHRARG